MIARVIAALLLVAALTGCAREAEKSSTAGRDFQVDTLFTHEGCTVYRFHDEGRARYFTNCTGSTVYQQFHGKGQSYSDGVIGGKP